MTDTLYTNLLDTYAEYGIEICTNLQDYAIYISKSSDKKAEIVRLLRTNRLTARIVEMDELFKIIVR